MQMLLYRCYFFAVLQFFVGDGDKKSQHIFSLWLVFIVNDTDLNFFLQNRGKVILKSKQNKPLTL